MDDGLFVNSVWYSCKFNKMNENILSIARQIARMSSSDLNELSSALVENGMSATIYRFSPTVSIWDNKKECSIALLDCNRRKLAVVKALKENFGWGLKEAKGIADEAPTLISKKMNIEKAEIIKDRLEEAGAKVEIRYYQ